MIIEFRAVSITTLRRYQASSRVHSAGITAALNLPETLNRETVDVSLDHLGTADLHAGQILIMDTLRMRQRDTTPARIGSAPVNGCTWLPALLPRVHLKALARAQGVSGSN
jgi:hypothetical protein